MGVLPDDVQQTLKPFFPSGLLSEVRFGTSHHTAGGAAMTDCKKIYFPSGSGAIRAINGGQLFAPANENTLIWLLHELTHANQCDELRLGRGQYAVKWFCELEYTVVPTKNPVRPISQSLLTYLIPGRIALI
jgi:hypothetical protein